MDSAKFSTSNTMNCKYVFSMILSWRYDCPRRLVLANKTTDPAWVSRGQAKLLLISFARKFTVVDTNRRWAWSFNNWIEKMCLPNSSRNWIVRVLWVEFNWISYFLHFKEHCTTLCFLLYRDIHDVTCTQKNNYLPPLKIFVPCGDPTHGT